MDVFPALLDADLPFYSHEVDAYWNDIGNIDELRVGNMDALQGAVSVEIGAPEVSQGIWAATDIGGAEVSPPVLAGEATEVGEDVRIDGPAVIGDRCRIGGGCRIRDAVLLEGAELEPGTVLVGGIVARSKGGGTDS
jgi:NDP-sugar pyrophosphorylase family protein